MEANGLPSVEKISVNLVDNNKNAIADVEGLEAEICQKLIENLHEKKIEDIDRIIYCRPIFGLVTPTKPPVKNIQDEVIPQIPGLSEADKKAATKAITKAQRKKEGGRRTRKVSVVKCPGVGSVSSGESSTEEDDHQEERNSTKEKVEKFEKKAKEDSKKRSSDALSPLQQEQNRKVKMK